MSIVISTMLMPMSVSRIGSGVDVVSVKIGMKQREPRAFLCCEASFYRELNNLAPALGFRCKHYGELINISFKWNCSYFAKSLLDDGISKGSINFRVQQRNNLWGRSSRNANAVKRTRRIREGYR